MRALRDGVRDTRNAPTKAGGIHVSEWSYGWLFGFCAGALVSHVSFWIGYRQGRRHGYAEGVIVAAANTLNIPDHKP